MTHKQNRGIYYFSPWLCLLVKKKKILLRQAQELQIFLYEVHTVPYLQLANFFCSGFNTWPKLTLRVDLQWTVKQNVVVLCVRIIYRGLPLAFSDNEGRSIGTSHFYYCKYKVKRRTQSQKGQQPPWFVVCCFNTQDNPFQLAAFPFPDGKLLPT